MRQEPFPRRLERARRQVAAINAAGLGELPLPACLHRPGWADQLGAAIGDTHGHGVRLALAVGGAGWASGACAVFPPADPDELTARVFAARPDGPVWACPHYDGALDAPRPYFELLGHGGARCCSRCLPLDPFAGPPGSERRCAWCGSEWPRAEHLAPFVYDDFTVVTLGRACPACRAALHTAQFGAPRMGMGGAA